MNSVPELEILNVNSSSYTKLQPQVKQARAANKNGHCPDGVAQCPFSITFM